eukprot:GHVS01037899.1.p1 GENE.GHVS01037899.1~~GHVS01037899.1.p1  ORF type:complete len:497 (-),score=62.14 GHVS01037899.1:1210-2661(-)
MPHHLHAPPSSSSASPFPSWQSGLPSPLVVAILQHEGRLGKKPAHVAALHSSLSHLSRLLFAQIPSNLLPSSSPSSSSICQEQQQHFSSFPSSSPSLQLTPTAYYIPVSRSIFSIGSYVAFSSHYPHEYVIFLRLPSQTLPPDVRIVDSPSCDCMSPRSNSHGPTLHLLTVYTTTTTPLSATSRRSLSVPHETALRLSRSSSVSPLDARLPHAPSHLTQPLLLYLPSSSACVDQWWLSPNSFYRNFHVRHEPSPSGSPSSFSLKHKPCSHVSCVCSTSYSNFRDCCGCCESPCSTVDVTPPSSNRIVRGFAKSALIYVEIAVFDAISLLPPPAYCPSSPPLYFVQRSLHHSSHLFRRSLLASLSSVGPLRFVGSISRPLAFNITSSCYNMLAVYPLRCGDLGRLLYEADMEPWRWILRRSWVCLLALLRNVCGLVMSLHQQTLPVEWWLGKRTSAKGGLVHTDIKLENVLYYVRVLMSSVPVN